MRRSSGLYMKYVSTWQEVLKDVAPLPALTKNTESDVCVIGSGIAGITTAYLLSKEGKRVVVIDKKSIHDSVTAYTTAFLTSSIDTYPTDLIKMYGKEKTKLIFDSHEDAIDTVEYIVQSEHIDCEFKRVSNYELSFSESGYIQSKEDAQILNRLGHEMIVGASLSLPFHYNGIVESPSQAKFHPIKYILSLREKAMKQGVEFYEKTKAVDIDEDDIVAVRLSNNHTITCSDVVIATYNPFMQPWWYRFKKGMYVSYVYEVSMPTGLIPEGLYEDDDNPYFYFRIDKGEKEDRMIIGGADHREELPINPNRGFKTLDDYIFNTLKISNYKVIHKWYGPILEQTDGIAYIGRMKRNSEHCYVATAFSGNGMTYGTLSGMIITDLIMKRHNKYKELYLPYRAITLQDVLRKGRDYGEEFFRGMKKLFTNLN
jgi:glycine/D-amino acid oxidase-like deaminating enzyme